MQEVDVVEFRLPNGQQIARKIEINDQFAGYMREMEDKGFRLECETLRTGQHSWTIADTNEDVDVSIKIFPADATEETIREGVEFIISQYYHEGFATDVV